MPPYLSFSLSWSFLQVLSLDHVESFINIGVQVYDEISIDYFNQLQDSKPVECDFIGRTLSYHRTLLRRCYGRN